MPQILRDHSASYDTAMALILVAVPVATTQQANGGQQLRFDLQGRWWAAEPSTCRLTVTQLKSSGASTIRRSLPSLPICPVAQP